MARANRRQRDRGEPEKWAPGRTLYSMKEMHLTADDLSTAAHLLAIEDEKLRAELTKELQAIATSYWEQHCGAARPSANWYRTKVGRIQNAAENLLKLIREPQGSALSQLRFRTERRMGRSLLAKHVEDQPSIEQLLDDFVSTCKSCRFKSAKGAPTIAHIKEAVAALRNVWVKFTKTNFPLNLQSADNRRDRDGRPAAEQDPDDVLTSPAPSFVQTMMQRIDPEGGIGSIRTSLREASVKSRRGGLRRMSLP